MKVTKDFLILDNEVRLHDELGGGCVCEVPERVDGSLCSDDANDACGFDILRGRMGVIMCAVVLMLFSWLMVSCSESKEQKVLNRVESVIEAHPDSALTLLRGVDKASLGSDKERARYALLMSMALDKNYIDTTSFDVIQPAMDYYLDRARVRQMINLGLTIIRDAYSKIREIGIMPLVLLSKVSICHQKVMIHWS